MVRSIVRGLGLLGLALVLVQCDQIPSDKSSNEPPLPSLESLSFDIDVTTDQATQEILAQKGLKLQIDLAYYGTPLQGATLKTDESGLSPVGHDRYLLDGQSQTLHVLPKGLNRKALKDLENQNAFVNLRGKSSAKIDNDNMVDCTTYDEPLSKAKSEKAFIRCRLYHPGHSQLGFEYSDPKPKENNTTADEDGVE